MNDIIIIAILLIAAGAAVYFSFFKKGEGACDGHCGGCGCGCKKNSDIGKS